MGAGDSEDMPDKAKGAGSVGTKYIVCNLGSSTAPAEKCCHPVSEDQVSLHGAAPREIELYLEQ